MHLLPAHPTAERNPPPPPCAAPHGEVPPRPADQWLPLAAGACSGPLIVLAGLVLVGLTALIDYATGPELSFAIFYLIPIALGAWWGGFAHGILLALASTVAWHGTDLLEYPLAPPGVLLWNGIVRFCFFVITSSLLSRLRVAMRREQNLARTDPLTGVANARTFYEAAHLEIERAARAPRPFTLAYLDVDNFKQVNDRLGHSVGDVLLREVAETIRQSTRVTDVLARLGGDEFALLLPETAAAAATAALNKVREALARRMAEGGWTITFSIGAATFQAPPRDVDLMVRHVDALMYSVKRGGKNCIRHEIVLDPDAGAPADAPQPERRAVVRVLCNLPARVTFSGSGDEGGFATIRDIIHDSVHLHLDRHVDEGVLVTIEPLCESRVKTLLARVVATSADGDGWAHRCELSNHLSDDELRDWQS